MISDPNPSPDTSNYIVGKGITSFQLEGTSGYRDMGNIPKFTYAVTLKKLDHFSAREGVSTKDKSVVIEKSATITLEMEEWSGENLSMALLGDPLQSGDFIDIFAKSECVGAIRVVGTNEIGPRFQWDFPSVSFVPGKGHDLISDTWGTLEIVGDVLLSEGTYGRVTRLA